MISHSEEVNRFAYVPKDWMDELSSQHRPASMETLLSVICAVGRVGRVKGKAAQRIGRK
jgi:hypothetical protein